MSISIYLDSILLCYLLLNYYLSTGYFNLLINSIIRTKKVRLKVYNTLSFPNWVLVSAFQTTYLH